MDFFNAYIKPVAAYAVAGGVIAWTLYGTIDSLRATIPVVNALNPTFVNSAVITGLSFPVANTAVSYYQK